MALTVKSAPKERRKKKVFDKNANEFSAKQTKVIKFSFISYFRRCCIASILLIFSSTSAKNYCLFGIYNCAKRNIIYSKIFPPETGGDMALELLMTRKRPD
jgi:hypothetical protein